MSAYDIVCIPDLQVPDHHHRFVKNLTAFIKDYQPGELCDVGDFYDFKSPARWSKGYAEEYIPQLYGDIEQGKEVALGFTAAAPDARRRRRMGNHDERVETYIKRYAPALDGFPALQYERLVDAEGTGWEIYRQPFDLAPGWVCAHGHEGSLNQTAGLTALGLARKLGKSVVCGHTHRAGLVAESKGYSGKINSRLYGLEVGNGMDVRKADYLKSGSGNWQMAFGILHVLGKKVFPELIYADEQGRFFVEGAYYSE